MPASRGKNETLVVVKAMAIIKKALRLSIVSGSDPFTAVQQAAEELGCVDCPACQRIIEELTESDTVSRSRTGGQEFLLAVAARLKAGR